MRIQTLLNENAIYGVHFSTTFNGFVRKPFPAGWFGNGRQTLDNIDAEAGRRYYCAIWNTRFLRRPMASYGVVGHPMAPYDARMAPYGAQWRPTAPYGGYGGVLWRPSAPSGPWHPTAPYGTLWRPPAPYPPGGLARPIVSCPGFASSPHAPAQAREQQKRA